MSPDIPIRGARLAARVERPGRSASPAVAVLGFDSDMRYGMVTATMGMDWCEEFDSFSSALLDLLDAGVGVWAKRDRGG